jgi:NAD(P)-dependent dehydrogenase (short-subunit alcohol dehydrogenase family)
MIERRSEMAVKNILMIGGASGIGAMVIRLLNNQVRLFIGLRSVETIDQTKTTTTFKYDVHQPDKLPDDLPESLDGLVYFPGTIRLRPFMQLKDEDFVEDLTINYLGAIRVLRSALPRLKKAENGASIVLFSTVAVQTGMPYHTSIAGAKGAIEGLTRSLAAELAPKIRVNAVAPSLTDTPLAAQLLSNDQRRQISADRHPLKRIGHPADPARAVLFLLSDQSSWMTGQILAVDGGMSAIRIF